MSVGKLRSRMDLHCCDNLELMAEIADNTIDLIYCDILYGTGRKFDDYQDLRPIRSEIEKHYIPRIKEMHRILKDSGSIYLQMDTKINHWMRIILDDIFGLNRMLNELVWCYRSAGFQKNKFSPKHDVVLLYSKTKNWKFNLEEVRENEIAESTLKRFGKDIKLTGKIPNLKNGKMYYVNPYSPPRDWIDINTLPQAHNERNGYDTQKPKELISKFIKASSDEGDLVADFYAGSFTTAEVCKDLNRNFIGCDINPKAVEIGKKRVENFKKVYEQKTLFETTN